MHERTADLDGLVLVTDELERAFEEQLGEYSRLAFRVAYSVVRQRQDAEDVAQDALVRAHQRLATLRNPARVRAWIVRMTWRLALDRRRGETRRRHRELVHTQLTASHHESGSGEREAALMAAIDALPEKLRLVIVLNSLEGRDVDQVAALLGVPPGTVKSRLFTARQRLRRLLEETRQ
jgi:RNA polymerase sigma-70 factor (ECF subfamily)